MNQPAQDHAFILRALLAAAHITGSIAAAEAMPGPTDGGFDYARQATYALAWSQVSLACLWVVMGQTFVLIRWVALVTVFGFWLPLQWRPFENNFVPLNIMVWQAAGLVLLLVALHWRGWRIVNVLSTRDNQEGVAAKQFHLEHLFLITTVVAAGVGAGRFLDFDLWWRRALLLGLANAAAATVICRAMLSTQHASIRFGLTFVAVFVVTGVFSWLMSYEWEPLVGLYVLHSLLLAISLWIFRLCGFRLCRSCEL
jgi:hypothetical protein